MWRSSISAVIAVSVVAACSPKKEAPPVADTGAPAPAPAPTPTPVAPGHVAMKLNCLPDSGFSFSLTPWKVAAAKEDTSFTWDNDATSNADAEITAGNGPGTPPFGGQAQKANHGVPLHVKPIPGTLHYKPIHYTVTAVCPDGQKRIIDPDMIIPF